MKKTRIKLFLIVLPLILLVFIFSYIPLFGWLYAFCDYQPGISIFRQHFVGLKYFKMLFAGVGDFAVVMRNTLVLSGIGIIFTPLPVIFAIMLSRVRSSALSRVVQTVTSLPNFLSWVLVYSLFFSLFNTNDGVINNVLLKLGIISQPTNVLADSGMAWWVQTFIGVWKNLGWTAIIYIAAMSGIDQELYDAADVDGAGSFQKILHVTIPGVLPTYFVMLLLSIANMLNNGFDQYYVFQNPLTVNRLEVLDTYIYKLGLYNMQYSFSTAIGMFKSLISVLLLTFANRASKLVRGETIF